MRYTKPILTTAIFACALLSVAPAQAASGFEACYNKTVSVCSYENRAAIGNLETCLQDGYQSCEGEFLSRRRSINRIDRRASHRPRSIAPVALAVSGDGGGGNGGGGNGGNR